MGDLNNVNRDDFIVGASLTYSISIALSNTNNSYSSPFFISSNCKSDQVISEDINNDGFMDIIITSSDSDFVKVLAGNGSGTNFNSTNIYVGNGPLETLIEDINNDGLLDLIVANYSSQDISIITNLNNNNYSLTSSYAFSDPYKIVSGDFDSDGLIDICAISGSTPSCVFLKNNGGGIFSTIATSNYMGSVASDINNDGFIDLIGIINNTLTVYKGNNNFTFSGPTTINNGINWANYLTSGDLNNDGAIDLLVCNISGSISVLTNTGNGNFLAPLNFSLTPEGSWQSPNVIQPQFTMIKDINNDGKSDIVIQKNNFGALNIFENCNTVNFIESSIVNAININPNPTNGLIKIINYKSGINIKIKDIRGCELKVNLLSDNINISDYETGIYFLSISDENNKTSQFKIIKTN